MQEPAAAGEMSAMTAEWVSSPDAFASMQMEWNDLLVESRANVLFLTWEWQYTWWRTFGTGRQLAIVVVRRNGKLIGVAPLLVRPRCYSRLIPYRVLEFIGSGSAGSDYLDVIIRKGEENEVLGAIGKLIDQRGMVLEAKAVIAEYSLINRLSRRLSNFGWYTRESGFSNCPRVILDGHTWPSYMAGLGKSRAAGYRRKERRMNRNFRVDLDQVTTEEQRDPALQILFDLHLKRWENRGGSSAFHTAQLHEFHREFSALALARGWLRLYVLRMDGRPAAAVYGFCYQRTFYYYQAGFDPEFNQSSPGFLMVGMTIQRAIEEGVLVYDFLRGEELYKSFWANDQQELLRIDAFPWHLRGRLCSRSMNIRNRVKALVQKKMPEPIRSRILSENS